MAKRVEIESTRNSLKLTVDGSEIDGVQEYSLHENKTEGKSVTVKFIVTKDILDKVQS